MLDCFHRQYIYILSVYRTWENPILQSGREEKVKGGGWGGGVLAGGNISKNILLNLLIFQDTLQFYDTPRNIKEALGSSHQSQKVEF